jgi:ATP-dependent DNA helicase RecQ
MTTDPYQSLLQEYWGYADFRGIQREIIESIGSGHDTLGLMPTGGGKSLTFQIPALATEGTCIVVTPLIALMKDQVNNLRKRGIKATAVYTGMTHSQIITALENCILGNYKLLYVSPERLGSELFLKKLRHIRVSFITVDEAHCISQWGYDFRPSYLRIADIRKQVPQAPVLALTASATPEVVEDIQDKLAFHAHNVFRMSFMRENIAYVVRYTENKENELVHIIKSVPGSAIVYTRSRKSTKEIADRLNAEGISALHYHAGLSNAEKDMRQNRWQADEVRVMVATNAFGMGIDKASVRLVAHVDLPDSPEAYFQEAGRAGRDGQKAYAVLLYNKLDRTTLKRRIPETYPDKKFIRQVYEELSYFFEVAMGSGEGRKFEFDIDLFCRSFHHFPVPTVSALQILTQAGYISYTDEDENTSRLKFTVKRDELYQIKSASPELEQLINAVLRCYAGVFADYVNIEERQLAYAMKLIGGNYTEEQANAIVYNDLKLLSQRRIISYVPSKKTPHIAYTQRREEANKIHIGAEVYDTRKEQYTERIKAMINYAENKDRCRSRILLEYFGEKDADNCGICDICLREKQDSPTTEQCTQIAEQIKNLLADGQRHDADILLSVEGFRKEFVDVVLQEMVDEEIVRVEDGEVYIDLPKKNA